MFIQYAEGATDATRNRTIELFGSDGYTDRWVFALLPSESNATGMQFAATAVVLVAAGLIVGTAFEVSVRRQLRLFGLVTATGGEPRHVFSLTVASSVVLGLMGAVVGVLAGSLAAMAASPYLDRIVGRLSGPLEFPILGIVGGALLGLVAAVLSALRPARTAARITAINALAGRLPRPRSAVRLARIGVTTTVAGAVLTGVGTVRGGATLPTIGLIGIVVGTLASIPMLVGWVGRIAARLPLSGRIAARDTARYGRRTSGAVAAAAIALALPVAAAAAMSTDSAVREANPAMAANLLIVRPSETDEPVDTSHPLMRELVSELFPDASAATIVAAAFDSGRYSLPDEESVRDFEYRANFIAPGEPHADGSETVLSGAIYIGDADLLRALGAERSIPDLEKGVAIAFDPAFVDGDVTYLQQPNTDFAYVEEAGEYWLGSRAIPAVVADAPRAGRELPDMVVSSRRAAELGLTRTAFPELLLAAAAPISSEQLAAARAVTARYAGASILGLEDTRSNTSLVRVALVAASGLLALAIVGVALGLVAAESRRDQAIMDAVGAGGWTRRKIVASGAMLVTALAAMPAVLIGFLPISIYNVLTTPALPVVVPWPTIGAVLVVIPLVAGAIAFVATRRPSSGYLRRTAT
ncbi:MAG: ABC transporter permease [Actinobacteria bacterium]|nr:ABC transporter permease [Actinomycetota bacterium]